MSAEDSILRPFGMYSNDPLLARESAFRIPQLS